MLGKRSPTAANTAHIGTVLICSLDHDHRTIIHDFLEHEGYETICLARLEDCQTVPRIMAAVIDLTLYETTHLRFVRTLLTAFPGVPMIFFTAHDSDNKALESLHEAPWQCLRKPYDSQELKRLLQQAIVTNPVSDPDI